MSWYDYIPIAGSLVRLGQGDYKHAAADAVPVIGPYGYDQSKAFDEMRGGYDKAIQDSKQLGIDARNFQMQGLNKAEAYFGPIQQRLDSLYGPPGALRK